MNWFRIGFVVQRTKVYQTDFDIQRGFLVGFACKKASFTTYVFNPDASKPTVVLGVGMTFWALGRDSSCLERVESALGRGTS